MKYTAKGAHNRSFELLNEHDDSLGKINYDGWFSIKVDIMVGDEVYSIAPTNIWHTELHVKKGDQMIAEIKFNWIGSMVVGMTNGRTYTYKAGFWHNMYSVITEDDRSVAILKPEFIWSKFSFNYEIETDDNVDGSNDPLLLLICIYCCNLMHKRSFGGAA